MSHYVPKRGQSVKKSSEARKKHLSPLEESLMTQARTKHWRNIGTMQMADTPKFICRPAYEYKIRMTVQSTKEKFEFAIGIAEQKEDAVEITHSKFVVEKMYLEMLRWLYYEKNTTAHSIAALSDADITRNTDLFQEKYKKQLFEITNVLNYIIDVMKITNKKYQPSCGMNRTVVYYPRV